ncbi:MAG: histidine--tRNA ligase [Planctomycetaceae bacterium]|jgi:histidyl-tRNA synthetase|nr:histidine--tRNA ligase [Planctomycetaceae bacterium]
MSKKINTQNLKGVNDFASSEQLLRNNIMKIFRETFERYGYEPLDTAILCTYDLLAYKYDNNAEILHEIYKLTDQGERSLGLRYDLTIPFCKVIANNKNLSLPYRRYEMGHVFRNGPVKLGRSREFYQCDVDVVGIDGRYIEIEQLCLVTDVFNKIGIDVTIKWNNRKIMTGLLMESGIPENQITNAIGIIDKKEKISPSELLNEFSKIGLTENQYHLIIANFSQTLDDFCCRTDFHNDTLLEGIQEAKNTQALISQIEMLNNKTLFSPSLARGLGIYTGIVFEFYDRDCRLTCSLGGGGRYNKIITDFMDDGNEYPALGLSFGLEPIYTILKDNTVKDNLVNVYIIPMSTEIECLKLATTLRTEGLNVVIEMNKKKIKKCFEYADKQKIRYVIVVGENEIAKGLFTVKDMEKREQVELTAVDLVRYVKEGGNDTNVDSNVITNQYY